MHDALDRLGAKFAAIRHGTLMMVMATSGFMAATSFDQVTRELAIARGVERHRQIVPEICAQK